MELKYRADIDGLRAIAVLAVLFFHTEVPGFSGGFVGVDIFFVISGYLITSIILKEIEAGSFSIARFYERRIRRIFPALFPAITFVLFTGAYIFDAMSFKDLGQSITATTLFSSNILFWHESGYFESASMKKPLLHTWSLAVEEQFYIFFPLFLSLISKYFKSRYLIWMIAIFLLSLASSIIGLHFYPSATFYLVLTRTWELMAGSILALGVLPDLTKNWQKNLLTLTGFLLISFSIVAYTEATPFPGAAAIPPVLGSALIIYSGRKGVSLSFFQQILAARPLVFIGLISYSLYLWHWPLVAFWKFLKLTSWNRFDSAAIICSSIILATLSWMFVEQPFRDRKNFFPEQKRLFTISGIIMFLFISAGSAVYFLNGIPQRISKTAMAPDMSSDPQWNDHKAINNLLEGIKSGHAPKIIGNKDHAPTFVLYGDSHAVALRSAFEKLSEKYNLTGYYIARTAYRPYLGIDQFPRKMNYIDAANYNNAVISFINAHPQIKYVFIAGKWGGNPKLLDVMDKNSTHDQDELMRIGLIRTVKALSQNNKHVFIIEDVPALKADPLHFYYITQRFGITDKAAYIRQGLSEYNAMQHNAYKAFNDAIKYKNTATIPLKHIMFDSEGLSRFIENNKLLYVDDNHLSTAGALYVAPVFETYFRIMSNDNNK